MQMSIQTALLGLVMLSHTVDAGGVVCIGQE